MLKLIFWIIVGVLALSFFGISLKSIVSSPAGQENFSYLLDLVHTSWSWCVEAITNLLAA